MFRSLFADKSKVPSAADALPGRATPMPVSGLHPVLRSSLTGPWDGAELAMFGLGCFWGAERIFWKLPGVVSTQVGYAAGSTPNPTYREVCSGQTGHNEVVRVAFDRAQITYGQLLKTFWEAHDPTQGMRQGNDQGTQYRSGVYCYGDSQLQAAEQSRAAYQGALRAAGRGTITTEVIAAPAFYFAEDYHQQYLHKNPGGYCGIGGTGVSCPEGLGVAG